MSVLSDNKMQQKPNGLKFDSLRLRVNYMICIWIKRLVFNTFVEI